ncbi:MAG: hypothetical protein ACYDB7_13940, partial [Mycobacteriales bacterium]
AAGVSRAALLAVGVLDSFGLVRAEGVLADPDAPAFGLDAESGYYDAVNAGDGPAVLEELVAVRDLELVADWPAALRVLAGQPELRDAVLRPTRRAGRWVPSYTRWWLGRHAALDGWLPGQLRLPGGGELAGLFDPAPEGIDAEFLLALGVRETLADALADADAVGDLLDRLGDADRPVDRARARTCYAAAVRAVGALGVAVDPPLAVRAVAGDRLVVLPSNAAVVIDAPDLLPLMDGPHVPVPARLAGPAARLLGVPLASSLGEFAVDELGPELPVPEAVAGRGAWPDTYRRHPALAVGGRPVGWRLAAGVLHARDDDGLARGLAWAAGEWERRHAVRARLTAGYDPAALEAEEDLDEPPSRR